MKNAFIHSGFVIAGKSGIQSSQAPGFRVKPGLTIVGSSLNTHGRKPSMAKKVESA